MNDILSLSLRNHTFPLIQNSIDTLLNLSPAQEDFYSKLITRLSLNRIWYDSFRYRFPSFTITSDITIDEVIEVMDWLSENTLTPREVEDTTLRIRFGSGEEIPF